MFRIGRMVTQSGLTSLVILTVLLAGCDGGSSSGSSAATSTSSSTSTDAASSSTSASSPSVTSTGDGTATLTWIAPTQNTNGTEVSNLAGYTIYYGKEASALSKTITVPGAATTTYVVSGLAPGTYYFAVSAYTASGTDSALSDIESASI
jgi:hypothetical protein